MQVSPIGKEKLPVSSKGLSVTDVREVDSAEVRLLVFRFTSL